MILHSVESEGVADSRDAPLAATLRAYITWHRQLAEKLRRAIELCKFWQCYAKKMEDEAEMGQRWREKAYKDRAAKVEMETQFQVKWMERTRSLEEADRCIRGLRQDLTIARHENHDLRRRLDKKASVGIVRPNEGPSKPADKVLKDLEQCRRQLGQQRVETAKAKSSLREAQEEIRQLRLNLLSRGTQSVIRDEGPSARPENTSVRPEGASTRPERDNPSATRRRLRFTEV